MNCNIDLRVELRKKEEELKKAEEARQKAMDLAEARLKELDDSRVALQACMESVKAEVYGAFAKGGADLSGLLPEVDAMAFKEWLLT